MDAHMMRARLDSAIERAIETSCGKPMEWGKDDCALWCASILVSVLGFDAARGFRGRYSDEAGAREVLGPLGLAMTVARIAKTVGWRRIDPDMARTGDLGIVLTIYGPACVLFWRADQWVGTMDFGFATRPRMDARFVWCVV